jgi:dTMP kinase
MFKKPVIVFEGIEGSGKSYHINLVSKYLKKKNIKHIKIREPGGNINSEKIRSLILNNKSNFNKNTDLLLYTAARSENINQLQKHYKKMIILIDRFVDSTIAYQHYGLGVNRNIIDVLNKYLLKDFKVDLTFLNIVNKKNMFERLKKRKNLNRYDRFNYTFYNKVQNGYLKIYNKKKKNYQIINSNLDISLNKNIIMNRIERLIK